MKLEIIQYFKAKINTVTFNDEMNYYTTVYVLNIIEEKFGEIYTDEFISELAYAIERVSLKCDEFSYTELENALVYDINLADKFENIYFDCYYIPKDLNERLAAGEFTK